MCKTSKIVNNNKKYVSSPPVHEIHAMTIGEEYTMQSAPQCYVTCKFPIMLIGEMRAL